MATLNMATGAILSTVTTTAETISDIFSSVGTGAKMINDFADNARWKQQRSITVSKVGYEDNLKTTKALEIAQSRKVLRTYIDENPDQADEIGKILSALTEALA